MRPFLQTSTINKILKALLLTIAGALLVGFLKEQQTYLAAALLSVLIAHLAILWQRQRSWQLVAGEAFNLVTFGVIGFLTESWGTQHGHWAYYYLPEGQTVPLWVPVAWAIAAVLLGKSEEHLMASSAKRAKPPRLPLHLASVYALGMLLPLVGESICIALGVWEYHWPLKVLGVPLLALALIAYAHFVFSLIRAGGSQLWRVRQGIEPQEQTP